MKLKQIVEQSTFKMGDLMEIRNILNKMDKLDEELIQYQGTDQSFDAAYKEFSKGLNGFNKFLKQKGFR